MHGVAENRAIPPDRSNVHRLASAGKHRPADQGRVAPGSSRDPSPPRRGAQQAKALRAPSSEPPSDWPIRYGCSSGASPRTGEFRSTQFRSVGPIPPPVCRADRSSRCRFPHDSTAHQCRTDAGRDPTPPPHHRSGSPAVGPVPPARPATPAAPPGKRTTGVRKHQAAATAPARSHTAEAPALCLRPGTAADDPPRADLA